MSTNFPTSIDALTNPTASDYLNSPSHSAQHANANDAIEAIEAKVGVDGSAVATSHDRKITALLKPQQGFLLNGKIVPSVSSNNLTVAIKGIDGNDPSASNPVYCRIGDTVQTLTAALSVTKNAGTKWCNAGSSELATKEIDYFVYLGYNAIDGVVIGFSRIPSGNQYDDFHATTTNEKYCAISTITNAAAGDDYELVGRFAATLSAGAGYTWSVPTFTTKNLIQRPIFETRRLTWLPTVNLTYSDDGSGGQPAMTGKYQIHSNRIRVIFGKSGGWYKVTANTTIRLANASNPFATISSYSGIGVFVNEDTNAKCCVVRIQSSNTYIEIQSSASIPNNQLLYGSARCEYEI